MKTKSFLLYRMLIGLALVSTNIVRAQNQAVLWIKDDILDVGAEPNTQTACAWCSVDIWVRRAPDPNYDPTPFPTASPPWTPLPHEDPCYRDPKSSSPNYIYVRIRNIGAGPSTGSETLHVYWAKANTGLSWSSDWIDHLANPCGGPLKLYGIEVTKPRKNGATATAQEKNDYVAAIQGINTSSYEWPDGVTYFNKQNVVHAGLSGGLNNIIHNNLMFLPWHREFISRYEVLLREVKPALTLLYWDWTTDPTVTGPIDGPSGYMGAATGSSVGAPFPAGTPDPPNFGGIYRSKVAGLPGSYRFGLSPTYQSGTLLPSSDFPTLWSNIESPSHNNAHCYTGGGVCNLSTAALDPIFFMLHANCDRLWAKWQRQDSSTVAPWNPSHAYDPQESSMTAEMRPFNGADGVRPWTTGDGYIIHKTPTAHSVVYPPIYDDSLLTVPIIPANYSCIIEIPFYPPSPYECPISTFSDPSHVCLLARIEPVNVTETTDLYQNVLNNRRIAWLNTHVQDCSLPPWFALASARLGASGLISNIRPIPMAMSLHFDERLAGFQSLFAYGHIRLRLEDVLYKAWTNGGSQAIGVVDTGTNNEVLVLGTGAKMSGIVLGPQQSGHMDLALELNRNYQLPFGNVYNLNVSQYDDQSGQNPVGGQNYLFDFNVLNVVQRGSVWKYFGGGQIPAPNWAKTNYDDSAWSSGRALFGYGRPDVETTLPGSNGLPVTTYFRQIFPVPDPTFYQSLNLNLVEDDGVVVYLNGQEIARANMPSGPITPTTPASSPMTGAASRAYHSIDVSNAISLMVTGLNVLAAEVHPASTGAPMDLTFDLQLAANVPIVPYQPPTVLITSPVQGGSYRLGTNVPINADVLDPDGDLTQVRIYTNNILLATFTNPPYAATFRLPHLGGDRVSVEAQDNQGHVSRAESLFSVVSNLVPIVNILSPTNDPVFPPGAAVPIMANASDLDGSVTQVVFYVWQHLNFNSPIVTVGIKTNPPYSVIAGNLGPGHYAAFAAATDNQGGQGYATPTHFYISQPAGTPQLRLSPTILADGSHLLLLEWDDLNAVLQNSPAVTGPWADAAAAASPYGVDPSQPGSTSQYFRLRYQ